MIEELDYRPRLWVKERDFFCKIMLPHFLFALEPMSFRAGDLHFFYIGWLWNKTSLARAVKSMNVVKR